MLRHSLGDDGLISHNGIPFPPPSENLDDVLKFLTTSFGSQGVSDLRTFGLPTCKGTGSFLRNFLTRDSVSRYSYDGDNTRNPLMDVDMEGFTWTSDMLRAVPRFFSHGWNQVCFKVATGTTTDCGTPVNRFFSSAGTWYVLCRCVGFQWLRALLLTANTYEGTIDLFAPGCSQILQPRLESGLF